MTTRACVVVLMALAPRLLTGQGVLVAPHAVYIDHATRSASLLLYNPNSEPAEVTISTLFGYPVTDSLGRMMLHVIEHADSLPRSAARWLTAFPRRLTVAPLERQTVRLLATPPAALPDGEYWARLVVAAKGGRVPISGVEDTAKIQVGLSLEVRTVIGVAYRKGLVRTGVRLTGLRAHIVRDSLVAWTRLEREGEGAFVGTLRGTLTDSTGVVRARFASPLGVYFELEPRFATAVGELAPGRYRLLVEATAEREDLPPEVILPAAPARDSLEVLVP
jgi:hypothetical protein